MIKKTYTSKSVASVRVQLGGGLSALVRFAPEIEGGSKFETTDTALQGALEAHPKYGKLFGLESSAESGEDVTLPKVQYYSSDEPDGHAVRYTPQTLTEPEREQARENIGASATPEELQNVLRYVPQTLSGEEQAQARENIGAQEEILSGEVNGAITWGNSYATGDNPVGTMYAFGKVRMLRVGITPKNANSGWSTILTLAEGHRPAAYVYAPIIGGKNVRLSTAGALEIYNRAVSTYTLTLMFLVP